MHSCQVKISAVVIALLAVACVGLAFIATQHEHHSLETEVQKRRTALTGNLANAARDSLLAIEQGNGGGELALERLVAEVGELDGVSGARLLDHEGRVIASAASVERR